MKDISTTLFIVIMLAIGIVYAGLAEYKTSKSISYPEEIQIAKEGDTLIVYSVKDSIYVKFKNK